MSLDFLINSFESYRSFNEFHPLISSILTAELIFPASDCISQKLDGKKINWSKIKYTAKLAPFYGLGIHYVVQTNHFYDGLTDNNYIKAGLGPNLFGNLLNLILFYNTGVGEEKNFSFSELLKSYSKLRDFKDFFSKIQKKGYLLSVAGTLTFWNAFQGTNLTYNKPELQVPSTLAMVFLWTILLHKLSSKKS